MSEELNLRILNSRVMNVKTIRNQRMTSLQFWLLDTYVAWLGGVLPTEESDSPVSWPLWCQTPWWFTYYGIWPHALACLLRIHKTKLVCTPQSLTHRCPSCISQSLTSRCARHDIKRKKIQYVTSVGSNHEKGNNGDRKSPASPLNILAKLKTFYSTSVHTVHIHTVL